MLRNPNEIRAEMVELKERNQAILAQAETQQRDLSPEEMQEFDDNSSRFDANEAEVGRLEALERQRGILAKPQPRLIPPGSPARQLRTQNAPISRGLGASIVNHPDFRAWHMAEGYRHRRDLSFEIVAVSTWPAESDMGVLVPGIGGAPSWGDTGTFRSLIPKSQGGGPAITTIKETAEDMLAGYQTDYGQPKKESTVTLVPVTVPTVTLAHYCRVPDQLIEDITSFEPFIETRLRIGLVRKEESELANGTGATTGFGTLQGLLPVATEVTPGGTGANAADAVQAAILTVQSAGFSPDAIVCSPSFWASIAGMKNTTGNYLIPALPSASAPMSLWGVRSYVSFALAGSADFLVGDFANGSRLFVAKNITIQIAYANDDFTRNLQTVRCELREAHVIYNAAAYCKQTGAGTMGKAQGKPASK